MAQLRVVRAAEQRRVRWRNGRGWTTEIHAEPAPDEWSWRLSLAESDGPADFSTFAGVDRELLLVHGTALRLRRPGGVVELRPGDSHRFAGEEPIVGEPVDGPTCQLNAMWRRDLLDVRIGVAEDGGIAVTEHEQVAVLVLAGAVRLDGARLETGDCAVLTRLGTTALVADGAAHVVTVRVTRFLLVAPDRPLSDHRVESPSSSTADGLV